MKTFEIENSQTSEGRFPFAKAATREWWLVPAVTSLNMDGFDVPVKYCDNLLLFPQQVDTFTCDFYCISPLQFYQQISVALTNANL